MSLITVTAELKAYSSKTIGSKEATLDVIELKLLVPTDEIDLNTLARFRRGKYVEVNMLDGSRQGSLFDQAGPPPSTPRSRHAEPAGASTDEGPETIAMFGPRSTEGSPSGNPAGAEWFGVMLEVAPAEGTDNRKALEKELKTIWNLKRVDKVREELAQLPCTVVPKVDRAEAERISAMLAGYDCDVLVVPWPGDGEDDGEDDLFEGSPEDHIVPPAPADDFGNPISEMQPPPTITQAPITKAS